MNAIAGVMLCLVLRASGPQDDEADDKKVAARNARIAEVVKQEMNELCLTAMRIEIKRMAEVMELDAKSVKRLSLGAKGAVKKTVDKYGDKAVRFVTRNVKLADVSINGERILFEGDDGSTDKEEEPAPKGKPAHRVFVQVKDSGFDLDVRQENSSSGSGAGGGLNYVRKQEVWKKTLNAVTSEEQRKRYDDYVAERRRMLAVELITRAMALDLRMTAEQTTKFGKWANQQIKTTQPSDFNSGSAWVIRHLVPKLDTNEVGTILDENQVRLLKIRIDEWTW